MGPVDNVVDVIGTVPWPSGWVWALGWSSVISTAGAVAVRQKLPSSWVSAEADRWLPTPPTTTAATEVASSNAPPRRKVFLTPPFPARGACAASLTLTLTQLRRGRRPTRRPRCPRIDQLSLSGPGP